MLSDIFSQTSVTSSISSGNGMARYAYLYVNDSYGKVIASKMPGAGWEFFIHDKGGRMVLTQDAVQRQTGEWTFRLQDIQGRETVSGTCSGAYSVFSDPLGSVNVVSSRNYPAMGSTPLAGYTVSGVTLTASSVLTAHYYDDHSFIQAVASSQSGNLSFTQVQGYSSPYTASEKGILTGRMESVLGNSSDNAYIYTAIYADAMGRTVQETTTSHLSGRLTMESVKYDFAGRATQRRISHVGSYPNPDRFGNE